MLLLSVRDVNPKTYILSPGNLMDPNPPVYGIQSATVTDFFNRQGTLGFQSWAMYSDLANLVNVNVSGAYLSNSLDPEGRFFCS